MRTVFFLIFSVGLASAEFRAGVARRDITPDKPIWMSGYANRSHPSDGVEHPLFAKALALEGERKGRAVLITTDLIGLPRTLSDSIAAELMKKHVLERAQILFNSSHTHTGPVVRANLSVMYAL